MQRKVQKINHWLVAIASFTLGVVAACAVFLFQFDGIAMMSDGIKRMNTEKNQQDAVATMECYVEKGQHSLLGNWNPSTCNEPFSEERPLVSIVTAFDHDHLLAAVQLLQTLVFSGYKGHLGIYFLFREGHTLSKKMKSLVRLVSNTSLAPRTFFGSLQSNDFMTSCFKAQVIQDYLYRFSQKGRAARPQVLIWADAHIRFQSSHGPIPQRDFVSLGAQRLLDDKIHFVAPTSNLGMVASIHPATYAFLEVDPYPDNVNRRDLCSCVFMFNLNVDSVVHELLNPWLHCGVNACQQCFAPIGTIKKDQSVLGILAYEYESHHPNMTRIGFGLGRYLESRQLQNDTANGTEELFDEYWYNKPTALDMNSH